MVELVSEVKISDGEAGEGMEEMDEVGVLVEKVMPVTQSEGVTQKDGDDEPQRLF